MGSFGFVELQCSGKAFEHRVRRSRQISAFHAHVVVDAHTGEQSDFLTAQPLDATVPAVGRQPACSGVMRARRELRNSRISARLSMQFTLLERRRPREVLPLPGTTDTPAPARRGVD